MKHPQRTVLTTLWEIIGSREVVEIPSAPNSCRRQPPGVVSRRFFFFFVGWRDGNEQSNCRPIGRRFRCHRESRNEVVGQPHVATASPALFLAARSLREAHQFGWRPLFTPPKHCCIMIIITLGRRRMKMASNGGGITSALRRLTVLLRSSRPPDVLWGQLGT